VRARGGRDEEFTAFVRERGQELLRVAGYLTADSGVAEDLLQVALIKSYVAWPAARQRDPYAYTRRVLVTSNIDRWRRRRWREQPSGDLDASAGAPVIADGAQAVVDRDALMTALGRLTPRERSVVVLRYCEDLSERDVADLLNVGAGTIKSTASRALSKLRLDPTVIHPLEESSYGRY